MLIERRGANKEVDYKGILFTSISVNQLRSFTKDERQKTLWYHTFNFKEKGKLQLCNKTLNLKAAVKIRHSRPITMVTWSQNRISKTITMQLEPKFVEACIKIKKVSNVL